MLCPGKQNFFAQHSASTTFDAANALMGQQGMYDTMATVQNVPTFDWLVLMCM